MPDLDEFLGRFIENYLVFDIQFMARNDESGRGIGYPMLMTCCAGIEFLGALRSRTRFSTHGMGHKYFADYWKTCLYPTPSPFNEFHEKTYQLVRHGIAHSFVTKGHIGVVRSSPSEHFTKDADGMLLIDAVQLGQDLITSYFNEVKPILTDPARAAEKASMQNRLTEMWTDFEKQAMDRGVRSPMLSTTDPSGASNLSGTTGFVTKSVATSSATRGPASPGSTGP